LQLKTDTYMMNDGSNRTLTPVIQVKAYSIYTKDDVENGLCTVEQIGRRKTDANGNYIYVLLEEVTFNAAGTEAYTNVKRSSTNILINGIICADTFFYNTTDKTVTIDLGDGKSYNLTPETFYWKVGTISTTELVLSYYVYLTGSQEGIVQRASTTPMSPQRCITPTTVVPLPSKVLLLPNSPGSRLLSVTVSTSLTPLANPS
jgi:hypothetical protein